MSCSLVVHSATSAIGICVAMSTRRLVTRARKAATVDPDVVGVGRLHGQHLGVRRTGLLRERGCPRAARARLENGVVTSCWQPEGREENRDPRPTPRGNRAPDLDAIGSAPVRWGSRGGAQARSLPPGRSATSRVARSGSSRSRRGRACCGILRSSASRCRGSPRSRRRRTRWRSRGCAGSCARARTRPRLQHDEPDVPPQRSQPEGAAERHEHLVVSRSAGRRARRAGPRTTMAA